MKEKNTDTFLYEDLGFPIMLINVPMKQIFGEWVLDINLSKLQLSVLYKLIHKQTSLTGEELHFIRKYFEMTTTDFGLALGVTHVAVIKWEANQTHISPTTEVYIRLYMLERLRAKDEELGKLYHTISISQLAKSKRNKSYDKNLNAQANYTIRWPNTTGFCQDTLYEIEENIKRTSCVSNHKSKNRVSALSKRPRTQV